MYFLQVLESGILRSGCQWGQVQRGLSSWLADVHLVTVPSYMLSPQGVHRNLSLPLITRPLISLDQDPILITSLNLNCHLPKASSPNTVTLRVRSSMYEFRAHSSIHTSPDLLPLSAAFRVSPPFPKNSFHLRSMVTGNKSNQNIELLWYSSLGSFLCSRPQTALGQPSTAEVIGEEEVI